MDEAGMEHRLGQRLTLPIVLSIALAGYLSLLAFYTAYSADDFWYSTFWNDGLGGYLKLAAEHYQTFNGRVLVHLFAHGILHCGTWMFALVMLAAVWMMPWLAAGQAVPAEQTHLARLTFLLGMVLLPRSMTVEGLTWISAFCNCVLSTVLLLAQPRLFTRFVREGTCLRGVICCVLSFLCGAATEQSGFVAVYIAFYAACLLISL